MKKKLRLLIVVLIGWFSSYGQGPTAGAYQQINNSTNWLRMYFRQLHIPASGDTSRPLGQWPGAGRVMMDTTDAGSQKGVYVQMDNKMQRLAFSEETGDSIFGSIYSSGTWANLSGFTNGSTATVSSGNILFSGGGGAPNSFTQYLSLDYTTGLDRWTFFGAIIVTEKSDTSHGVSLGVKSINSSGGAYLVNNQIKLDLTNGSTSGRLSWWNGVVKTDSSSLQLSFSIGDTVYLMVDRDRNNFITTAYNKTTNSLPVRLSNSVIGSVGTHNTGKFTIWANGGDFTIDSLSIYSKQPKKPELLILTDSRSLSYSLTDYAHVLPSRLNNYYSSVVTQGGNGDKTNESVQNLDEIKRIDPKAVWVITGCNDVQTGVPLPTTLTNIDTIHNNLTRAGIDVYHTAFYSSVTSQIPLSDSLHARYPDTWIDGITDIRACNGCLVDGTHFTEYGHEKAYELAIKSLKLPADQNLLTKINVNTYGIPTTFKNGGNSFSALFRVGTVDTFATNIIRNGRTVISANSYFGSTTQDQVVYPANNNTSANAAIPPNIPGAGLMAANYNGGVILNIAVTGADRLAGGGGLRLATHFDTKGTDDVSLFFQPGETTPRLNSWGVIGFSELAGGRLMTLNATPLSFDIGFGASSAKASVHSDSWRHMAPVWFRDTTAPGTPSSGYGALYVNGDSLYFKDDNSAVVNLTRAGTGSGGGSGVTTMANIGSSPNADGASISGTTLTLQPASGSFGGVVTTAAQTFAGIKTTSSRLLINSPTDNSAYGAVIKGTNDNGNQILLLRSNNETVSLGIGWNEISPSSSFRLLSPGVFELGTSSASDALFYTNSVDRLHITSGGNVGIGVAAPRENLDVNGVVSIRTVNAGTSIDSINAMENGRVTSVTAAQIVAGANVISGTYTPTLSNVTNVTGSTASVCQYSRVGNTVTVSGKVVINVTTGGGISTEMTMTLPIASAMTDDGQCAGVGSSIANSEATAIRAETSGDTALFQWTPALSSSRTIYFSFTYRII